VTQARSALCRAARLWAASAIAAQQRLQGAHAGFARLATQILAVQLDLIEDAYDRGRWAGVDEVEYCKPILVGDVCAA
jgi:hypothetical protein